MTPHNPAAAAAVRAGISLADFTVVAELVRVRSGIVLGADKMYLVETRLEAVLRQRRLASLAELVSRLRLGADQALVAEVVDAMTTNETLFFRDRKPFDHMTQQVLPAHLANGPNAPPLRVWSAAASSGQEAYSIAMTALEAGLAARSVQILGTDISQAQLHRARAGVYSEFEVQRGVPARSLANYFRKTDAGWRVADAVRGMVEFRHWNLLDDPRPLGQFNVVFCRNVLIYFDLETKRRVLQGIWSRMSPGGLLYLGGSETVLGVSDRFVPCLGAHQVYTAVPA